MGDAERIGDQPDREPSRGSRVVKATGLLQPPAELGLCARIGAV